MSFMMGFTANKLFGKEGEGNKNSIRWGCIAGSLAVILRKAISMIN
jgi:hypothetical protein